MIEFSFFTIDGEPQGKGRPRFSRGHTYTPQKTVDYENKIKLSYLNAKGRNYGKLPIFIEITAYYAIPKSANKQTKEDMINGLVRATKKPDFDNVAKAICDSLNGIAYDDDCQIVEFKISKYYSAIPRVVVVITPIT